MIATKRLFKPTDIERIIMNEPEKILLTEYSERFDEYRKNRMVCSFFKYGFAKKNYESGLVDSMASLKLRLNAYIKTGNTEYLVDVANFAMLEFMYPQHKKAHFKSTDSDQSVGLVGKSYKELERDCD